MMEIFNYLPKKIDLTEYFKSLPEEISSWISVKNKPAYLNLIPTDDLKHFRLSYTVYDWEGAEGYYPLTDEQIYEGERGQYVSSFEGGFVGDDVEELAGLLYGWCKENNLV